MAESHTYLNYVFSNNALVTDYYQSGKGERDESRDWEVCSLGVGDEAHSKCDLCGSQAGSGIRIRSQGQGFYQSYTMVWYVSYLQEYWRFLRPRASGDAVCFQVVLQGNQNASYIDTSMYILHQEKCFPTYVIWHSWCHFLPLFAAYSTLKSA